MSVDRWVWGALLAALAVVAAVQVDRYGGYFYDDAYISFVYARRLLWGQGLTWSDGAHVEGYSNLLWVLLCAGLRLAGLSWIGAAHLLGGIGLLLVVTAASTDPAAPLRPSLARVAYGGGATLLTGGVVVWAAGGLEQTLLAGLVTAGVVAAVRAIERPGRSGLVAGTLFAAAVLTRADAAVLWLAALAGVGVVHLLWPDRRAAIRALWPLAVLPAAALAAHEAFRVVYYDDWIPNTARAKVSLTWPRVVRGVRYVASGAWHHGVLVLGSIAAVVRERTPRVVVPAVTAGLWLGHVALVGGDFMAGWRFLVPALGLLGWLLGELAATVPARVAALALVPVWLAHGYGANSGRLIDKAFHRDWAVGRPIGVVLRTAFRRHDPLLAVDAAGAVPFYSQLRTLDMLGLNDRWLARHPPSRFGGRAVGHDLGDADYVWSRQPDLILFNGPNGSPRPRFLSGRGLLRRPDFADVYQYVNLRVLAGEDWWPVHLYVRREDGPLAVRRHDDLIEIPGHFLAARDGAKAYLMGDVLATSVWPDLAGEVRRLEVPAGRWEVEPIPTLAGALRCGGVEGAVVELTGPRRIDVVVRSVEGRGMVTGVALRRTTTEPAVRCP